ncbi:alpha/beta hydrolase [Microbacterium terregens]|uniref:Alpha/beta hydrolase n=1 Tax=Microbacterium terregens TaxID=69363 RepID=A0ABV5T264_9MICO
MTQSSKQRRAALLALGLDLSPEMVAGTIGLTAPDIDPAIYDGVLVTKDLSYGQHERHALDVYAPEAADVAGCPVLVYVHGGGFVRGAKDSEQTPYFKNIGSWAVQQGWVAVVINYRLAPEFAYPSGAEDVAAAMTWVADHIGEYGGDSAKVFLCGQSAGSMHVADYVVGHGGYGPHGRALAGAVIASCLYDVGRAKQKDMHLAYWGEDTNLWAERGTLQGLIETDLPLLCTVSEFDEPEFQDHATQFVAEWYARKQTFAPLHLLYSQNHLTPVYAIGSPWDAFGPLLTQFVEANA